MSTKEFVFRIECGASSGSFFATCDQHKGLLIVESTLTQALAAIMPALRDLLSVGPPHPDPHAFDGIDVSDEAAASEAPDSTMALASLDTCLIMIAGQCGTPDAAEGCRLILKTVERARGHAAAVKAALALAGERA